MSGLKRISELNNFASRKSKISDPLPKEEEKSTGEISEVVTGEFVNKALSESLPFRQKPSRKGSFQAGMLGSGDRMLLFHYMGMGEENISLSSVRYMKNGTGSHDRMESWLKQAKILSFAEMTFDHPTRPIRGRCDFVVRNNQLGRSFLIEFKTTEKDKIPPDNYLAQWMFYSECSKIYEGFLTFEKRSSLELTHYPLKLVDPDLYVYYPNGKLLEKKTNFLNEIYSHVNFAIWCSENEAFPSKKCEECAKYGCKYPNLCEEYRSKWKRVNYSKWKKGEI